LPSLPQFRVWCRKMAGLAIDPSISLGSLIQVLVVIGGGLIFLGVMKSTVNSMHERVDLIQEELQEFRKLLVQVAVQSNRLDRLDQDIRDLREGRGLVLEKFPKKN